jgi:hypothetical protein
MKFKPSGARADHGVRHLCKTTTRGPRVASSAIGRRACTCGEGCLYSPSCLDEVFSEARRVEGLERRSGS